ncbi:MAG: thioredoxin domain-containing protein [Actinomycetota bacterium]|nr:thioredoxin domain-containing protein [Actinomycetota bacterium]MDQ2956429.1 thioredoxin domain-containing protein [Actinomycetota bacterium]
MKFAALSAHRERLGWAGLVVRLVLAAVWAWASLSKIGDPRTFVRAVRAYDATPEWLSQAIGYGLPMLELVLAILLLAGLIVRYAAAVSAALFTVFIIGILQASARDIKISCGCFGGGGQSNSTAYTLDVLRDLGLLVLAVFLILWPLTKLSIDSWIISSEQVPGLTGKQAKSEKNLKRYRAARAAAEVELRHKQRYIAAGTAIAVILISFIAIGVQSNRAKISPTADTANATSANGVKVGNQSAPVLVDVYEDFQCPICNELEQSGLTADFDAKIKATTIKVNYHVMSFLDASSNGNKYSSRAANAGYCAADQSPAAFAKFHDILYGKNADGQNNQPAENGNGKPDSQLIDWGKQAGITSADFSTCVTSDTHKDLVAGVTDAASKRGVNGTPTVYVNNKLVNGKNGAVVTLAEVDAAIQTALSQAKSTAAPSPTATPSASGSATAKPPASRASTKPSASTSKK